MCRYVATLAVYVLARCPALFEESAPFALAAILFAVLDVLGPLLPLMLFAARRAQICLAIFHRPRGAFLGFCTLLATSSSTR